MVKFLEIESWSWKSFKLEALSLILIPFSYVLALLLGVLLSFCFIYRLFVCALARHFYPELSHRLPSQNCFFPLENIIKAPKSNVVTCFVYSKKEQDCLEQMRAGFSTRVLVKTKSGVRATGTKSDSNLVYREYFYYVTRFMGYLFWKREPNFDLNRHVRLCDYVGEDGYSAPSVCRFSDLQELATRLISEPWDAEFSPWEVLIIPNYVHNDELRSELKNSLVDEDPEPRHGVFIGRFHHALGDGTGWLTMFLSDIGFLEESQIFPKPKASKSHVKLSLWNTLLTPVKLPYDLIKNAVESKDGHNCWHTPGKRSKQYYSGITSNITVDRIKDIKNKFGVRYAAVVMSVICGGIRQIMKEAGQPIPDQVHSGTVLPMPGHPGGLAVHATLMSLPWPIGIKDPLDRVRKLEQYMKERKSNTAPMTLFYLIKLFGVLPNCIRHFLHNKGTATFACSLVPGPPGPLYACGREIVDSLLLIGLPPGQVGAFASSIAVAGRQRIVVTIDKTLYPSFHLFRKLGSFMDNEILALEKADLSCENVNGVVKV